MPSHFIVVVTCPHAIPGPREPSCHFLRMGSETIMVFAESRFLLTSCSLWRGRGELSRDFRHSLGMDCTPSLPDEEVEQGRCPALQRVLTVAPKGRDKTRCLTGAVCVFPVPPGNPFPLPPHPRQNSPEPWGLIAFSWSWGSLSHLSGAASNMHRHHRCHLSLLPPLLSPLPPRCLVPPHSKQS